MIPTFTEVPITPVDEPTGRVFHTWGKNIGITTVRTESQETGEVQFPGTIEVSNTCP